MIGFVAEIEPNQFAWQLDAGGVAELDLLSLAGSVTAVTTMSRASAHSVELLDDLDSDVLLGLVASIAAGGSVDVAIFAAIGADATRPSRTAGLHRLRITGAAGDTGVTRIDVSA